MHATFALVGTSVPQTCVQLLGRLHPAMVHFPIALISVAAVLETHQLVRRRGLAAATPACLTFGAASALAAAILGWLLAASAGDGGKVGGWHRWVGVAAAIGALVAAALLPLARRSSLVLLVLRQTLFAGALLVGITGYLGGEMVFGPNHLLRGAFEPDAAAPASAAPDAAPSAVSAGDFQRDLAPILREHCLRCHGGSQVKMKLSLKTRSDAFKGGRSGPCIVPGQPEQSLLYTVLVDVDGRMPPAGEKLLTPDEIEAVRAWIQRGADWPENVEIK